MIDQINSLNENELKSIIIFTLGVGSNVFEGSEHAILLSECENRYNLRLMSIPCWSIPELPLRNWMAMAQHWHTSTEFKVLEEATGNTRTLAELRALMLGLNKLGVLECPSTVSKTLNI